MNQTFRLPINIHCQVDALQIQNDNLLAASKSACPSVCVSRAASRIGSRVNSRAASRRASRASSLVSSRTGSRWDSIDTLSSGDFLSPFDIPSPTPYDKELSSMFADIVTAKLEMHMAQTQRIETPSEFFTLTDCPSPPASSPASSPALSRKATAKKAEKSWEDEILFGREIPVSSECYQSLKDCKQCIEEGNLIKLHEDPEPVPVPPTPLEMSKSSIKYLIKNVKVM